MVVVETVYDIGVGADKDEKFGVPVVSIVLDSDVEVEMDRVDTIGIVEVVMVHLLSEQCVVVMVVVEIVKGSGVVPGIVSLEMDEVEDVTEVKLDGVVISVEVFGKDVVSDVEAIVSDVEGDLIEVNVSGVRVAEEEVPEDDMVEVEGFDIERDSVSLEDSVIEVETVENVVLEVVEVVEGVGIVGVANVVEDVDVVNVVEDIEDMEADEDIAGVGKVSEFHFDGFEMNEVVYVEPEDMVKER